AFICLVLPMLMAVFLSLNSTSGPGLMPFYLVYGISIFLGFLSGLILVQTYKTLPFIVWLYMGKRFSTKGGLLPKDLYFEKLARWQFIIYQVSILTLIAGIISKNEPVVHGGSVLLMIAALLFNINVFRILLFTLKKPGLPT